LSYMLLVPLMCMKVADQQIVHDCNHLPSARPHTSSSYHTDHHLLLALVHQAKHPRHAGVVQLAHDARLLVQHGQRLCGQAVAAVQQLHGHGVALQCATAHNQSSVIVSGLVWGQMHLPQNRHNPNRVSGTELLQVASRQQSHQRSFSPRLKHAVSELGVLYKVERPGFSSSHVPSVLAPMAGNVQHLKQTGPTARPHLLQAGHTYRQACHTCQVPEPALAQHIARGVQLDVQLVPANEEVGRLVDASCCRWHTA
jgi:hypothetical protein